MQGRESDEEKSNQTMGYDRQIIIDFLSSEGKNTSLSTALAKKWDRNHAGEACYVVSGEDVVNQIATFPKEKFDGQKTKIYVLGHGNRLDSDTLNGFDDQEINTDELASTLAEYIGKNPNVVLNLIVCGAGASKSASSEQNSFAARLHFKICQKLQRNVPLIARNQTVWVMYAEDKNEGRKGTVLKENQDLARELEQQIKEATQANDMIAVRQLSRKLFDLQVSEQPGSKWLFTLDKNGNQIYVDAYAYKFDLQWKEEVMRFLQTIQPQVKDAKLKPMIDTWCRIFINKTPEDIYWTIQQELNDKSIVVQASFFSKLLGKDELGKALQKLLLERDNTLAPEGEVKEIKTGNGSPVTSSVKEDNKLFLAMLMDELDEIIENQRSEVDNAAFQNDDLKKTT